MPESKTLFQKIADREMPANFEHEDDLCFAIRDIQPQAPVHILVIPKKPIMTIQNAAPGPPFDIAMATPAMLPKPTVAESAAVSA